MTRVDWLCVLWLFGFVGAMGVYAMPSWDEPTIDGNIRVVKVKVQPVLIEGPREVKR